MRPFLLIIDGPAGAGKTTVAEIVHQKFPRTALLGHDRIVWFISGFKRDERNNRIVGSVGLATVREFLKCGMNVIVEQDFAYETIKSYQNLGKALKVKTVTVQLVVPRKVSLERIGKRNNGPNSWKVPRIAPRRLLRNFRRYESRPSVHAHIIDAVSQTPEKIATEIAHQIRNKRTSEKK